MRLPRSPLAVFVTLCAIIVPAGVGLTAPVWLMVMGVKLDRAADIGSDIVGVTVLACLGLFAAYWVFLRPRIRAAAAAASAGGVTYAQENTALRDRVVHTVVWMLFILPFVLIIAGFIFGQLEKLAAMD